MAICRYSRLNAEMNREADSVSSYSATADTLGCHGYRYMFGLWCRAGGHPEKFDMYLVEQTLNSGSGRHAETVKMLVTSLAK